MMIQVYLSLLVVALASRSTAGEPDWQRTVVYMKKQTGLGQDVFLRGGINRNEAGVQFTCPGNAITDNCTIPINVTSLGSDTHYDNYNKWSVGDNVLDWHGAESGQDSTAKGTPMAWTTNLQSNGGYQSDSFGQHWWKVDMLMDCSETFNSEGWFEFKGYVTNSAVDWESDITQVASCGGTAGGLKPFADKNHMGRCGFFNVFTFNDNGCIIDNF